MKDLNNLIEQLKETRADEEDAKTKMNVMLQEFQAGQKWQAMQIQRAFAATRTAELEAEIREAVGGMYKLDSNKKPHPKVEVKIFKTFVVKSADTVREWCFKNLPAALQPDMNKIEKYAKEFGTVDGTEITEVARVQIATKL